MILILGFGLRYYSLSNSDNFRQNLSSSFSNRNSFRQNLSYHQLLDLPEFSSRVRFMSEKILFKAGEATVFAEEGQYTDAMPEVLIGDVGGPVVRNGDIFGRFIGLRRHMSRQCEVWSERRPRGIVGSELNRMGGDIGWGLGHLE